MVNNYKILLQKKSRLPDITVIQNDINSAGNWDEAYWIGQYLFQQASGEADKLIMDAYEKAFELGLNIRTNRDCFLTATQQTAKIYFQFKKYDEAINKLMVLDSNVNELPDWVNLYYASAQIHTDNVIYWAEVPSILFKRIDSINENNSESVRRRKFLYLEFLNRLSEISKKKDISSVDKDAILKMAAKLGVEDSWEYMEFKAAIGILKELPQISDKPPITSVSSESAVYEEQIAELNKKIVELQSIIDNQSRELAFMKQTEKLRQAKESENKLQEEIAGKKSETDVAEAVAKPEMQDIFTVDNFLPRRQKILIIGGSETKETHLRGKLKGMGFEFSKDQLEFELDYDNVKDYASRIVPWSGRYAGIIVGPCPHKAKDIDGYSSFIEQMKLEEGYPHVEEARDMAGNLKISNSSIGEAMMRMAVYLQSIA